jgi:hypothetical protein
MHSKRACLGNSYTLAPVIDEGVSWLSFRLEDEEKIVPHVYIRELLGPKKEALEQVEVQENMLEEFLGNDLERRLQGTQNFSSLGFLWGSSTWSKEDILVKMRGEGASWCSSFQHGLRLFVEDKNWLEEWLLVPVKKNKKEELLKKDHPL